MTPRTLFKEEHELFQESVRKFLDAEAAPYHAQWEKDGQVDRKLWYRFKKPCGPEKKLIVCALVACHSSLAEFIRAM
ncbi:MAG: acyl-CoA dehydrogenase family protein [Colwellia sp.]|nr:acyl-CoA dehydrogenase family protein [Colwellia sp.]